MFRSKVISTKTRMTGLLVLSSLVHIYAFSFFTAPKETIQKPFIISASIVTPSSSSNRHTAKKTPADKPLTKEPITSLKKKAIKEKKIVKKEQLESIPTIEKKVSKSNNEKVNWFQVKSEIKSKIQKNFYYPRLAIRNNWQGTVLLSLTVDYLGKVTLHKITQSSGFSILDQAALQSISKIKEIKISKNIQYYDPVNIELPVIFKLNEG